MANEMEGERNAMSSSSDKMETARSMLQPMVAAQPHAEAVRGEGSRGGSQLAAGQEQAGTATAPPTPGGIRGERNLGRWLAWGGTAAISNP